jgi:hypothetical protein
VIARVEIGVGGGELGDRVVESVALAEVCRDRNPVAGASVCASERPATCLRVAGEAVRQYCLDVRRALPVPELTDVEVVSPAVDFVAAVDPGQKHVAGGLRQPLAFDHPPALLHADVAGWPEWQTEITEARIEGPFETGTSFDWTSYGFSVRSTIYDVDARTRVLWCGTAEGKTGIHEWLFTETPGGVPVETNESFEG